VEKTSAMDDDDGRFRPGCGRRLQSPLSHPSLSWSGSRSDAACAASKSS
jgi:hypothetical protein